MPGQANFHKQNEPLKRAPGLAWRFVGRIYNLFLKSIKRNLTDHWRQKKVEIGV